MQLSNFKQNMKKNSYKLGMHPGSTFFEHCHPSQRITELISPSPQIQLSPSLAHLEGNFMYGNIQHYLINSTYLRITIFLICWQE